MISGVVFPSKLRRDLSMYVYEKYVADVEVENAHSNTSCADRRIFVSYLGLYNFAVRFPAKFSL